MDVVVHHPDHQWTVRTCVLSSVSPVMQGFFESPLTGGEQHTLSMTGSVRSISVFLTIAHAVSYDPVTTSDLFDDAVDADDTSILRMVDDDVIELIFKYEAVGVVRHIQALLVRAPCADLVIRLCNRFPENTSWCTAEICSCVSRHLEASTFEAISSITPGLLARLLIAGRQIRVNVFRPVLDDRSLTLARQSLDQ